MFEIFSVPRRIQNFRREDMISLMLYARVYKSSHVRLCRVDEFHYFNGFRAQIKLYTRLQPCAKTRRAGRF